MGPRCGASKGFGDSAPQPPKHGAKGSRDKPKSKSKKHVDNITSSQVWLTPCASRSVASCTVGQALQVNRLHGTVWIDCLDFKMTQHEVLVESSRHVIQAVERAVRIAEGGAPRPVSSSEAAKGRLDYVQVLPVIL